MNRTFISLLSRVTPRLVAKIAYEKLTNPQIKKLRAHELEVLELAEKERVPFREFTIQTYTWGNGPNTVLLVHGWEGQAGNFADLVEKLVEANYKVHAFDGPSHGFSSQGKTSLFAFGDLVAEMIKRSRAKQIISHSFGGVATIYALFTNPDLRIEKYLLLTTPDKFSERIEEVSNQLGISKKVQNKLLHKLQKETGQNPADLNLSDFVKSINVKKALIIHDRDDKVIPIERSMNVARNWPQASIEEISGTGHFRILREPDLITRAIRFLSDD